MKPWWARARYQQPAMHLLLAVAAEAVAGALLQLVAVAAVAPVTLQLAAANRLPGAPAAGLYLRQPCSHLYHLTS